MNELVTIVVETLQLAERDKLPTVDERTHKEICFQHVFFAGTQVYNETYRTSQKFVVRYGSGWLVASWAHECDSSAVASWLHTPSVDKRVVREQKPI